MSGTCVAVGAVIGAAVGGGSSIYGIRSGNRKLLHAFQKQMYYMQMNYNYNQQALDAQEKGAYDAAVSELFNLSYSANQNNATVDAALAEQGFEGRSAEQLHRSIHGQTDRQKQAIKDAYGEAVYNIRTQKDALYVQMKAGVESARDQVNTQFTKGLTAWKMVLDAGAKGAAIGAATGGAASAASGAVGGAAGSGLTAGGASLGSGATSTGLTAGSATLGGGSSIGLSAGSATLGGSTAATTAGASTWSFGTWLQSFGSNFAQRYYGTANTMGYGQMANMFSSGLGGTNQQYTYRRY